MSVVVGLIVMASEGASKLAACRLGLVLWGSGEAELRDAVEALLGAGFHLRALFSPEHGLSGVIGRRRRRELLTRIDAVLVCRFIVSTERPCSPLLQHFC